MLPRLALIAFCILFNGCSTSSWTLQKDVDPLTDYTNEYAQLINYSRTLGGQNTYAVVRVGCGPAGLYVNFRSAESTSQVSYRIDKNPPISATENNSLVAASIGVTLFGRAATDFVQQASVGSVLFVRLQDLSALTQSDHTFDLVGGKNELSKAIMGCS